MFQKFFESNNETTLIKNIIANTPIPVIPTVNNHSYIIHTMKYIYGDTVIECLSSGYIEPDLNLYPDAKVATYRVIQAFHLGETYTKFTEKYISKDRYYDSETHYYLGRLLRCIRDTSFIDLMPFYNCFNYKVVAGSIKQSSTTGQYLFSKTTQKGKKVFAVPIKFNQTYTIALDAYVDTYLTAILYSEQGEIVDEVGNPLFTVTAKKYSRLEFLHPITFSISPNDNISTSTYAYEELLGHYEKYLYLLIQLPENIDTSLVVLEGDYTHSKSTKIISGETDDQVELNNSLIYNPALLLINDKNIYAYSNRLIEYLLLAPISSSEDIWQNINRIQTLAKMTKYAGYYPNSWSDKMRRDFYNSYLRTSYREDGVLKLDVNGFVDKNIEKMILRGKYK